MVFDVYGRFEVVAEHRAGGRWSLARRGADGKRSRIEDVVVPDDATLDEVEGLLEVAFHEWAIPGRTITRLDL